MKKRLAPSLVCGSLVSHAGAFVAPSAGSSLRGGGAEPTYAGSPQQVTPSSPVVQSSSLALGGVALLAAAAAQVGKRKATRARKAAAVPLHAVKVGDPIPNADLHKGFPPTMVPLADYCKGKKVVLVPGYMKQEAALRAKGVSDVLVYCVNDGAVMTAWAAEQGCDKSDVITLLGDPRSELTEALGLVLDHPGPVSVLGSPRCKRFSMLIDDGVIKTINVAEGPDDPAGDDKPDVSLVEKMLGDLA